MKKNPNDSKSLRTRPKEEPELYFGDNEDFDNPVRKSGSRKRKKKSGSKTVKLAITLLILILLSVFLFSAYKLYDIYHGYKVAEDTYKDMSEQYVTENTSVSPSASAAPGSTVIPDSAIAPDPSTASASVPISTEFSPISVNFNDLLQTCSDVVGWIYGPDTVINYPIVQANDNQKYLHALMNGSYNANGTIFTDYRNNRDFSSRVTFIYGHHMNDGSMFASICNYSSSDYMAKHPYMYLNTPTQNYRIEIFSGFVTTADSSAYTFYFDNDDALEAYAAKMKAFSDIPTDVAVHGNDKIVVLSTCTYEYDNARYVVFGKLVPIN